jgi:4-hydroxy-tetrahydrodipicolinate reductase
MKYGVFGSNGRLGKEVVNLFTEKKHQLVFEYNLEGSSDKSKPEVIIDCSLPEVFDKSLSKALELSLPFIVAVTGLSENQLKELKEASEKIPVVQSYNFSIGIQVLLKLTELAKQKLNEWDVEISETHHRFKKDKPSGTAKMIADLFKGKNPNISSLRLGNIAGDHTISFGGLGETLSITHSATSRRTFAEGILLSAEFIVKKKNGLYSFTEVVFGK